MFTKLRKPAHAPPPRREARARGPAPPPGSVELDLRGGARVLALVGHEPDPHVDGQRLFAAPAARERDLEREVLVGLLGLLVHGLQVRPATAEAARCRG